ASDKLARLVRRRRRCAPLHSDQALESVFYFFFQAEDGIRDRTVTGVQTCALPISAAPAPRRSSPAVCRTPPRLALRGPSSSANRSEERRVGKECRCWLVSDH